MTRSPLSNELSLLDLAIGLYDSESKSGLECPFCKGGTDNESSFFLRREGRYVYYKCYRAKCGVGGRLNVTNTTAAERKTELGGKRRVLETSPLELDEDTSEYLKGRYYLSPEELRRGEIGVTKMHCHQCSSRVYLPMFRRDGTIRGYTARDVTGEERVKALSFRWRDDEPNLAWYSNRKSKSLIIVEDCFSALRASSYLNGAALLGVDLSKDKVDEIVRGGFTSAYLALDGDATRVAIKQSLALRSRINLRVLALDKDIKDMTREELKQFMVPLIDGT